MIQSLAKMTRAEIADLAGRRVRMHGMTEDARAFFAGGHGIEVGNVIDIDYQVLDFQTDRSEVSLTVDAPGESQPQTYYQVVGADAKPIWGIEVLRTLGEVQQRLDDVTAEVIAELTPTEVKEESAAEPAPSPYEQLGPEPAALIDRVVEFLYSRIRLDDLLWDEIFQHVPMGMVKAKFRIWITWKLGGPMTYRGDMSKHQKWPITDEMFARVADYLIAGFLCEHIDRDLLGAIESAGLAERPNVVRPCTTPTNLDPRGGPA